MSRNTTVLTVSTWKGIVGGASHFYGRMEGERRSDGTRQTREVSRVLTLEEAKRINGERDDGYTYKAGDDCVIFHSEAQVLECARVMWQSEFVEAEVLLQGNTAVCGPQKVVAYRDAALGKKLMALVDKAEKLGWYETGKYEAMDKLVDQWDKLMEQKVDRPKRKKAK